MMRSEKTTAFHLSQIYAQGWNAARLGWMAASAPVNPYVAWLKRSFSGAETDPKGRPAQMDFSAWVRRFSRRMLAHRGCPPQPAGYRSHCDDARARRYRRDDLHRLWTAKLLRYEVFTYEVKPDAS